ncbi:aldo keto reductase [Chrysochromulina tobinii]|uniref:Aldo keto reductase n=1 Tax=Chrysochromulina tobinii TaxID=1460289 RepID=A0A0M0K0I8_9EUKA|nr:aldo keto reductase [Chrysochromulina tobinii]|eukprot:KOO32325.1 aldo keto reductase [Chrysochromulina sp. CCMP291]
MIAVFLPLLVALLASTTESCADGGSPRIVIGAWQLLERHRDESMAVETVRAYMAAGFEHFDTADIYGKSESLLGRAGAKHIYTKYVTSDASEANARAVNAQSRTALGVVPSLVQFHWWDWSDRAYRQAARHLLTLKSEGLLGEAAACNFDTAHLRELVVDEGLPLTANQVQYSLIDLRPENAMLAFAR